MKNLLEWLKDFALAFAIALVILAFFKPIIIQQESMVPTFEPGDYVVVSRQAYKLFGDPKWGDVIVFKSDLLTEDGKNKNLIKRIVGVPGDEIFIKDGYVYLNGEKIDEPYVNGDGLSGEMEPLTVPDGALFVMGDNRAVSVDSRSDSVGFVDQETVLGKVKVRFFPLKNMAVFK